MDLKNNALFKLSFEHPILLYDGNCILCSGVIQWVIRNDKKVLFRFSRLQENSVKDFLFSAEIDDGLDSVILLDEGKLYYKSDAAFLILDHIEGYWRILKILKVFPLKIRDWIYQLIAKNRYRWFGQKENCLVPTKDLSHRFV